LRLIMNILVIALRTTFTTLAVTGLAYPLVMTGVIQVLFADKANGSLVTDETGQIVGSRLIGQTFTNPAYLQGRPSAAGNGYDATASGGSNLGPAALKLRERMKADAARLRRENPEASGAIPAELLTASASGLDPHLGPAAARWQLPRIAAARHLALSRVQGVLDLMIEDRDLGLLGEPTVNVLMMNLALDRQFGRPAAPAPAAPPRAAAAGDR
jgi:K+-transporting ATPase ATPase C chain